MEFMLPSQPSALIRLALNDLRWVERIEGYHVDMGEWHKPGSRSNGSCAVCLAGAVIAISLGEDIDALSMPDNFPPEIRDLLFAIDAFRSAWLPEHMEEACRLLGATPVEFLIVIPSYRQNCAGFHAAMQALAMTFERSGQ